MDKTAGAIKNEQIRDTGNTGHKTEKTHNRTQKNKGWATQTPQENCWWTQVLTNGKHLLHHIEHRLCIRGILFCLFLRFSHFGIATTVWSFVFFILLFLYFYVLHNNHVHSVKNKFQNHMYAYSQKQTV